MILWWLHGVLLLAVLPQQIYAVTQAFELTVWTSDIYHAGTISPVSVEIMGTEGTAPSTDVGAAPSDLERNTSNTYTLNSNRVGIPRTITFSIGPSGDIWSLERLTLKDVSTGKLYSATCNCWVVTSMVVQLEVASCAGHAVGRLSHPSHCQKYYTCDAIGNLTEAECDTGLYLYYNPTTQLCDYPVNVPNCVVAGATSFASTKVTGQVCFSFTHVTTGSYDMMETIEIPTESECYQECVRIGIDACASIAYDDANKRCSRITDRTTASPLDCSGAVKCFVRNYFDLCFKPRIYCK